MCCFDRGCQVASVGRGIVGRVVVVVASVVVYVVVALYGGVNGVVVQARVDLLLCLSVCFVRIRMNGLPRPLVELDVLALLILVVMLVVVSVAAAVTSFRGAPLPLPSFSLIICLATSSVTGCTLSNEITFSFLVPAVVGAIRSSSEEDGTTC